MSWKRIRRNIANLLYQIVAQDDTPTYAKPLEPWPVDPSTGCITSFGKLAVRMGWVGYGERNFSSNPFFSTPNVRGFRFVNVAEGRDKMFVIFILENEVHTIEDDPALFPSDALVAKLRLVAP